MTHADTDFGLTIAKELNQYHYTVRTRVRVRVRVRVRIRVRVRVRVRIWARVRVRDRARARVTLTHTDTRYLPGRPSATPFTVYKEPLPELGANTTPR